MTHLRTFSLFLALLLIPLSSAAREVQQRILRDDRGAVLIQVAPPRRIVSLAPNVTEVLFALGLDREIIGVTRYCNHPKAALDKEKIGGLVDPDLEKILSLEPDLIIAFRGNPLHSLERLQKLRLSVFVLDSGKTLVDVLDMIRKIGQVTWREREAGRLAARLQDRLSSVRASLLGAGVRPRVFLDLYGKDLWTSGKDGFLNDLVSEAGGINIAGTIPRAWLPFNREEILYRNPEHIVVFAPNKEAFLETKRWLSREAHLESVLAVRQGNIHWLDEDLVARPGPRLFDALEQLVRMLHPDRLEERR